VADIDRRQFLKAAGLAGMAAGVVGVTGGCSSGAAKLTGKPVRIGVVSNQTGALSGFGEADSVVIANIRSALKDGITIGGKSFPLQIELKDTGSQPQRSAQVASDLINSGVDLLLATGAPEIVNPACTAAEKAGTPCLSTNAPWQAWFFGRTDQDLAKPHSFNWTYHLMWGLEDLIAAYQGIWSQVTNNKVVASLFTHDPDGDAWANKDTGLPPIMGKMGYTFVQDPRPQDGANDYSALLRNFAHTDAQILTGNPAPPDFATFWQQANQTSDPSLRFRPQIATVGKALLFPAFLEVLKPSPVGLTSEVTWHPTWPTKSSLTGLSAAQWADEYTRLTHRQWTQPIGTVHALFEVAISALQRAGVGDPQAIVDAVQHTSMDTIVGHLSWASNRKTNVPAVPAAAKNISKFPVVGGQWVATPGKQFPFDLLIVANPGHPEIPVARRVQALSPLQ